MSSHYAKIESFYRIELGDVISALTTIYGLSTLPLDVMQAMLWALPSRMALWAQSFVLSGC